MRPVIARAEPVGQYDPGCHGRGGLPGKVRTDRLFITTGPSPRAGSVRRSGMPRERRHFRAKFGQTGFWHGLSTLYLSGESWHDTSAISGDDRPTGGPAGPSSRLGRGLPPGWPRPSGTGRRVARAETSPRTDRGKDAMTHASRASVAGRIALILGLAAGASASGEVRGQDRPRPADGRGAGPTRPATASRRAGGRRRRRPSTIRDAAGRDQRRLGPDRGVPGDVAEGGILAAGDRPDPVQERRPHVAMNLAIYAVGMMGFWACGFALMFGGHGPFAALGGPGVARLDGLDRPVRPPLGPGRPGRVLPGRAGGRGVGPGGLRVPGGVHGHGGDDPDRGDGRALEVPGVPGLRARAPRR